MPHKLLIFDCDGVLVDTERIGNQVMQECIRDLGIELNFDDVLLHFKGRSSPDCVQIIKEKFGVTAPQDFIEKFRARSYARYEKETCPIPGIEEALVKLKDYKKCVASSGTHKKIEINLNKTGLKEHFQGNIFSAEDVKNAKPDPELFLYAAEKNGVKPEECIVIEDSVHGVVAAKNAGMKALGFSDLTSPDRLEKAGALPFNSMYQLPDLIISM